MFDFYQIIDFKCKGRNRKSILTFKDRPFYADVKASEYSHHLPNAYVTYLERSETCDNICRSNHRHFFIYGSIFTNNNYYNLTGRKPVKLDAPNLAILYLKYRKGIVRYIKGSFVVCIYNEEQNALLVITARSTRFGVRLRPILYTNYAKQLLTSFSKKKNKLPDLRLR